MDYVLILHGGLVATKNTCLCIGEDSVPLHQTLNFLFLQTYPNARITFALNDLCS